jgi:exosome complex RNA-binding protein Rrp42 (RNase PH superfamily)
VRANQGGSLSSPEVRNVAVINAAKQTRVDSETSKKREELQRRIEETRRKLQSVGFKLLVSLCNINTVNVFDSSEVLVKQSEIAIIGNVRLSPMT